MEGGVTSCRLIDTRVTYQSYIYIYICGVCVHACMYVCVVVDKDACIHSLSGASWTIRFVYDFNDWKLELVDCMLDILYSNILMTEGLDCLKWRLKSNGKFDLFLLKDSRRIQ